MSEQKKIATRDSYGNALKELGSAEKDEYLMNNGVLAVKIGCFCGHIFRNYGFSKIEKDPK